MIRKVAISNFYSIKNRQEINLVLGKNAPNLPDRFASPFLKGSDDRIPKVIALFGPNASGKTTALRGMAFLKWFVESSFDTPVAGNIPFISFLGNEEINSVTELSVELYGQIFNEELPCIYRYELAFKNYTTKPSIVTFEKLSSATNGKFRRIFERNGEKLKFGHDFQIRKTDPRSGTVRPNASLISTFAKFGHPFSLWVLEGVRKLHTNIFISKVVIDIKQIIQHYSDYPTILERLNDYIQIMDLGIKQVEIRPVKTGIDAFFIHTGLRCPLALEMESQGTYNFFAMFPYLHYVLESGGVAILDEFDTDIHPLIIPEILRWFYDPKINKYNAQLIISCHNATLLETLAKEEIYFTEKNNKGETEIYGLKDIQDVRRDTNIYKKYLGGAFGAVPHIG
jgi:hypothetical protein